MASLPRAVDDIHNNRVALVAGQELRRLAPAAIKQVRCSRDTGALALAILGDPGEHLDAQLGVPTRQRAQIGRDFLSGQLLTGLAYPLLLAQASNPHPCPTRVTITRIV